MDKDELKRIMTFHKSIFINSNGSKELSSCPSWYSRLYKAEYVKPTLFSVEDELVESHNIVKNRIFVSFRWINNIDKSVKKVLYMETNE